MIAEQWAVLELYEREGQNVRVSGLIRAEVVAGMEMVRVRVPTDDKDDDNQPIGFRTVFFDRDAIQSIHPVDEANARIVQRAEPWRPVHQGVVNRFLKRTVERFYPPSQPQRDDSHDDGLFADKISVVDAHRKHQEWDRHFREQYQQRLEQMIQHELARAGISRELVTTTGTVMQIDPTKIIGVKWLVDEPRSPGKSSAVLVSPLR